MEDNRLIEATYQKMYEGMVTKNEPLLREVLDDSFVLVHMTGMKQPKEDFIGAVMNGTLNYFSGEHESLSVNVRGEMAFMTGRSKVAAAVFGGGQHTWRLQQKCILKKSNGSWKITRSVVSTY